MIAEYIKELVSYALRRGLVDPADEVYTVNRLLELFGLDAYPQIRGSRDDANPDTAAGRPLQEILDDMLDWAAGAGLLPENTITWRDLFDTKIMGLVTPPPSAVQRQFAALYAQSPRKASDFYYRFSQDTNYIRTDRIARDEKWTVDTPYGTLDITINLSKPEKDPRDIARAGQAAPSGYPACLLCRENEGYAGHFQHPARQNHRLIPLQLMGEDYFLQYSPYVYYNEHCIILNKRHIPMKVDKAAFLKLLDFVRQFPHYMAGSNADLPIVGGSILSHDHFQGGGYTFAMAKAPMETLFSLQGYPELTAGIVKWPMSVIRLQGPDLYRVADAADQILTSWRAYTDESCMIYAETDGAAHNTITPIARMRGDLFELDLVLRNNLTTKEAPWGLFHPTEDLHHIKKENIGLIEVMGLAILPARLKTEMAALEEAILNGKDLRADPLTEKHADWAESFLQNCPDLSADTIHDIICREIGQVFVRVLECAGVYKRTAQGQEGFLRFIKGLGH